MTELSLSEITDWRTFECLVADYFKEVKNDESNVESVTIYRSGIGTDGGNDILVKLIMYDSIAPFARIWVIQCKFHDANINIGHLSNTNIQLLLQQHKAHGYLLVCKKDATSTLTESFRNLNENCVNNNKYEIWNGIDLLNRVRFKPRLIENYFPLHNSYLRTITKMNDK